MIYIPTMREVNLKSLDLNLLIALNALLEEKHITRAAERISLSQPAMSRAFARLKKMFNDPLLVKSAKGLVLTERAMNLYHPLQLLLRNIHHLVTPPTSNPAEMKSEIVIATRDYELAVILPTVINKITQEAPGLTLRIVPMIGHDLTPLDHHKVDMIICATDNDSASLHRHELYRETFVSLVAKDNPQCGTSMTLAQFTQMKHCLTSTANFDLSIVDQLLLEQNLKRNVVVRVPHFFSAVHVVANSDLMVTVPKRLGEMLAQQYDLRTIKTPLNIPAFPIFLYWHTRNQTNLVHQWVRQAIKSHLPSS